MTDDEAVHNADKLLSPGVQDPGGVDPGGVDPDAEERELDACVYLLLNPDDLNAQDFPMRPAERAKAEAWVAEHGNQRPPLR